LRALAEVREICAARPAGGGWELAVVRYGRLAGAGYAAPGAPPRAVLAEVRAASETVLPGPGPLPAATAEETGRILAWLERPETRLVEVCGTWASGVRGAARFAGLLDLIEQAGAARPADD
ncbi:MAG TPA: endonuclease, partial [Natronosporangium sp.]|nr:endonuclease [Natronosporangium sp.]